VQRPIYAGGERALVRLGSGEYICVDTNSLDSIDYLLRPERARHLDKLTLLASVTRRMSA
jgi:hypothetical protein